jgi:hypothetical protein
MTQDQYGQPRNTGYVVRGEVVQDGESDVPPTGQAAPITQFQKVASALRAHQPDQPADEDPDEAHAEEVRAVSSPDAGHGDYWDDDEDAAQAGPADELEAGPAEGAPADASALSTDPGAGPTPPAAEAEEAEEEGGPADPAPPDADDAADPAVTQPRIFAAPQPAAATVPTVPVAVAEEPAGDGGRHAAPEAEAEAEAEAELRPGESGTTLGPGESGYASLLPDTEDLRAQWHRIQYKFVDDPRVSVTEAADVISQVTARLEAAIAERQRGLRDRWDGSAPADTETLRETLRMYRSFLDQLIGPEPS